MKLIQDSFNPMQFFDLTYSVESNSETSKTNNDEVDFIEQLIKKFVMLVVKKDQDRKSQTDLVKNFKRSK